MSSEEVKPETESTENVVMDSKENVEEDTSIKPDSPEKQAEENQPEEHIDDPEIEAWLNGGDDKAPEKESEMENREEIDIPDDVQGVTTIENNSEVVSHENEDMCEIGDDVVARVLMRQLQGKKGFEDIEMEEEVKEKKLNRNSRAAKKQRAERAAAALKEKKEKEVKAQTHLEEAKAPVSKYNYSRPTKKTSTGLQSLAKKQQKNKEETEKKQVNVDIHQIFHRSDRSIDPKLARILHSSAPPKVSSKSSMNSSMKSSNSSVKSKDK